MSAQLLRIAGRAGGMNPRCTFVFTLTALLCALSGCVSYTEQLSLRKEAPETASKEAFEAQSQPGPQNAYAYLKANKPEVGANFGRVVRLSGDASTLVVSAPEANKAAGEVYVMRRVQSTWVQEAVLKAGNADAGDHFGNAIGVSADGNTIIVGAPDEASSGGLEAPEADDNHTHGSGAAYVYARGSGGWAQQRFLKPRWPQELERYGAVVAVSPNGEAIAVGAPCRNASATTPCSAHPAGVGAVDVLHRKTGADTHWDFWGSSARGLGGQGVAATSDSLSFSSGGEFLAVGEPYTNPQARTQGTASCTSQGRVALYEIDSPKLEELRFTIFVFRRDTDSCGGFGNAVALSANGKQLGVLTGSPMSKTRAGGRVHLFHRPDARWIEDETVEFPREDSDPDRYYSSLALSADMRTLVVSDPRWDKGLGGSVLSYTRSGSGWVQSRTIHLSAPEQDDSFGASLSLSADGRSLAIGAPRKAGAIGGADGDELNNKAEGSGAAYVWRL